MASQTETTKSSTQVVKVSVFFNKKPDITDAEFNRYWSDKHGPLVRSLPIVQKNILKYNQQLAWRSRGMMTPIVDRHLTGTEKLLSTINYMNHRFHSQYHTDMSMRSKAVSLGLPVLEYDGIAEFLCTDLEILLKTWMDPEFHQVVTPDEQKFMTREGVKFMIGYDNIMMDHT